MNLLLTVIFILCLWRATGVWYGYRPSFDEDGSDGSLPMKLLLYSLVPLISLYIVMDLRNVAIAFLRMPVLICITIAFCLLSVLVSIDPAALCVVYWLQGLSHQVCFLQAQVWSVEDIGDVGSVLPNPRAGKRGLYNSISAIRDHARFLCWDGQRTALS